MHRQRLLSSRLRFAGFALPLLAPTIVHAQATPAGGTPVTTPSPAASPISTTTPWLDMATAMWDAIQRDFAIPDFGLYRERAPQQNEDNAFSYLWPYSALVSGINALAITAPDEYGPARDTVLDNLEKYYDPHSDPSGYDSYVVEFGGGDKFYDDNEWLGIDFTLAWQATGNDAFLDKAREIWTFAISGWSDDFGGGIYWKQGDFSTKNTCSNGPAAVLAMLLHDATGEQDYLDWAIRILDWTKQLKDESSGVYADNINDQGIIEPTKWTYNTGTPLHANALLYAATNDETYLNEARSLAAASLDWFGPLATMENGQELHIFPDTPWFNSILFRGLVALAEIDPEPDWAPVTAMLDFTAWGWTHARDENGFLNKDWSGRNNNDDPRALLDQAPVIEIAATAARLTTSA